MYLIEHFRRVRDRAEQLHPERRALRLLERDGPGELGGRHARLVREREEMSRCIRSERSLRPSRMMCTYMRSVLNGKFLE